MLERVAAEDPRVRFERNDRNLGHAANFRRVVERTRGEYFMWLSDDDWLDPGYVDACLATLEADPSLALVGGQGRYFRDGEFVLDERPQNLLSRRPLARVAHYYAWVAMNGLLFGLGRRETFMAVPFKQVVGGDWLTVATIAYRGRVRTLEHVHVNRSIAGLSEDPQRLARSFGLSGVRERLHHAFSAAEIAAEIGWREPVYGASPRFARLATGLASGALVAVRHVGWTQLKALGRRLTGRP
jgi:glycosyltransferase involved in cell wall biosynthesis